MNLYEAVKTFDFDFDIEDQAYDFYNYFTCCTEDDNASGIDYYDKVLQVFAHNIEVVKVYKIDCPVVVCDITSFIKNNLTIFDKFCNENNKKEFTPKFYMQEYGKINGEDFYDIYIETFQALINGLYSEDQYEDLYNIIKTKKHSLLKNMEA